MSKHYVKPESCRPPHKVTHPEAVDDLYESILNEGWRVGAPSLVGYIDDHKIQLLSGTHRHAAASRISGFRIPVYIINKSAVQHSVGNPLAWKRIMELGDEEGTMGIFS